MNRLRDIFSRLYADFLMPSRLQEYGQMLETALEAGYRFDTIRNVWQQLRDDDSGVPDRTLILRHDVDTDPGTAARKLAIETALGIHCSYFFRLCTVDIGLMQRIEALGGEASYHYEEIATFAKAERIKQREEILSRLPEIRACFADNLERLRRDSGLGMTTVASRTKSSDLRTRCCCRIRRFARRRAWSSKCMTRRSRATSTAVTPTDDRRKGGIRPIRWTRSGSASRSSLCSPIRVNGEPIERGISGTTCDVRGKGCATRFENVT